MTKNLWTVEVGLAIRYPIATHHITCVRVLACDEHEAVQTAIAMAMRMDDYMPTYSLIVDWT